MGSHCIQATSSKSISVPNQEASIFTLPGKVPLWQKCQNVVLCDNMNMNVSPYILEFSSSSKILILQWLIGFMLVYCSQKVKWYTFPKGLSNLYPYKHNTYSRYFRLLPKSYYNFNVLLQALPYIFFKFSMVWNYLLGVTTRYRQIYKKICIYYYFF